MRFPPVDNSLPSETKGPCLAQAALADMAVSENDAGLSGPCLLLNQKEEVYLNDHCRRETLP